MFELKNNKLIFGLQPSAEFYRDLKKSYDLYISLKLFWVSNFYNRQRLVSNRIEKVNFAQ